MKNTLSKVVEKIKINKKKIMKVVILVVGIFIIGSGVAAGVLYNYAKSNINYNQKQLEEIAIRKIPGEVVNIKKEFEFEDTAFEYTFYIKDKEGMLQEITLSSKSGAIMDMEITGHDLQDNDNDFHDD